VTQRLTLSRQQIADICIDLGLEDEDAEQFWRLACIEALNPGQLRAKRAAETQRALDLFFDNPHKEPA